MLKKVIKLEMKETGKVMPWLILLMIGLIILGVLANHLDFTQKALNNNYIYVTAVAFYIVLLTAISVVMFGYLVVRYYKTMYTDQGYLTHTLPVTPAQLIIGKGIVFSLWYLICYIVNIGGFFALIYSTLIPHVRTEIFAEMEKSFSEINALAPNFGLIFCCLMIVTVILSSIGSFFIINASTAIGQLFSRHKIIGSIVGYLCITFVIQILSLVVLMVVLASLAINDMYEFESQLQVLKFMNRAFLGTCIEYVIISVALFFVSKGIISTKLNLD